MEIFRTDGGGRSENPPRLLEVVGLILKTIPNNNKLWNNIISIQDNKGFLTVTLDNKFFDSLDETYLYYLFMKAWDKIGENYENVAIKYGKATND